LDSAEQFVHVRDLTIHGFIALSGVPACIVTNSSVVFEMCSLVGADAFPSSMSPPGQLALS
jgi:hypothetical protein